MERLLDRHASENDLQQTADDEGAPLTKPSDGEGAPLTRAGDGEGLPFVSGLDTEHRSTQIPQIFADLVKTWLPVRG